MNPNLFNPNGAKPYSRQRPFTKKGEAKKLCDNHQQAQGLQLKTTHPGINQGVCLALTETQPSTVKPSPTMQNMK